MTESGIKYVGVDGCTGGWVAVGLGDGVETCVKVFGRGEFPKLLDHFSGASVVLVDMPIGLREDGPLCYRACDNEARCLLRERKGSVFQVPSRQYLDEAERNGWWSHNDYDDANGWSKDVLGGGISKQSFGIIPKIDEVDKALTSDENASSKVREVHPELCFWALNGKSPMQHKKSEPLGFDERVETLRRCAHNVDGIDVDAIRAKARREEPRKTKLADDDILDALAAAITAKIGCQRGGFETLPENPPTDSKGLPMEMVYAIP